MHVFITEAINRPGEFALHAAAVAARGINVEAWCLASRERGEAAFLTRDEDGIRSALADAGIRYREVPVVLIALEDQPGRVATACRRLADANVNIEFFAPVDFAAGRTATIAIGVDHLEEAKRVLADLTTDWTQPAVG